MPAYFFDSYRFRAHKMKGGTFQNYPDKSLAAYFERSRSGNCGHIWIFFVKPFADYKSRRIIISLLTLSGILSAFDKNTSS